MNKIKIIESSDSLDYNNAYTHLADSTEWTSVDDETLAGLRHVVNERNRTASRSGKQYIIVCEVPPKGTPEKLSMEKLIQEAKTWKTREAEKIKKNKQASEKRQQTIQDRRRKQEKALLEELKKKYEAT